jgi:hypothetical protein
MSSGEPPLASEAIITLSSPTLERFGSPFRATFPLKPGASRSWSDVMGGTLLES